MKQASSEQAGSLGCNKVCFALLYFSDIGLCLTLRNSTGFSNSFACFMADTKLDVQSFLENKTICDENTFVKHQPTS